MKQVIYLGLIDDGEVVQLARDEEDQADRAAEALGIDPQDAIKLGAEEALERGLIDGDEYSRLIVS